MQQLAVRQEDLVDEIQVLDTRGAERCDFFHHDVNGSFAVAVAEVVLCAKRAVIRTPARRFELGAGRGWRRLEAVMVMAVRTDDFIRPAQRGQGRDVSRMPWTPNVR